jgi:predicted nucleotidyltransferase component of viral defense system
VRNALKPSKILRTVYSYVPLGLKYPMTIKVEINLNENASLFPLVPVEVDLLDDEGEVRKCSVRSYQINEMLGTKLRALMQRTQGRDLFDLYHAGELGARGVTPYVVNQGQAIEAFTWYLANEGTRMDREEADRLLRDRVRDAAFRRDMNTLLRADYGVYDVDAASALVRDTYLVHLA